MLTSLINGYIVKLFFLRLASLELAIAQRKRLLITSPIIITYCLIASDFKCNGIENTI